MDAFELDLGTTQGRIVPAGWTPPSGDYAFVLGHELPGVVRKIVPGDGVSIAQTIDLAGSYYLRMRARIRMPESVPSGYSWQLYATMAGDTIIARILDRTHELQDLSMPVGLYGGMGSIPIEIGLILFGPTVDPVDVELPAVYLDAFVSETQVSLIGVCNRDPEPGESAIPLTLPVSFVIADPSGTSGIDTTSLVVSIGGVLAYSGSTSQNGYTAGGGLTFDENLLYFTLTPPANWTPLTTYDVVIQASTNTVGVVMTSSYTFTTEDTIAPVVVSALGTDELVVRVSFDEAIGTVGSPDDYVITLVSCVPAVTPVVMSVALGGALDVLLTIDMEQTPGAVYQVTVGAGVVDLFGNAVASPLNAAQWTGYACTGVAGRSFDLYGMLLRSDRLADETGDLRKFVGCYQEVTDRLLCRIDRFVEILDPDTASEQYLDEMLADLGNPFEFDLTEIDKRRLVQILVAIYRQKGTDAGIINAVRFFLGLEITITVPWQTGGLLGQATIGGTLVLGSGSLATKYTMVLHSSVYLTEEQRARMTSIAKYMRRAPVHFVIVEPSLPPDLPNHWSLGLSRLGQSTYLH